MQPSSSTGIFPFLFYVRHCQQNFPCALNRHMSHGSLPSDIIPKGS